MRKTARQLDSEIAAALARRPIKTSRPTSKRKTLHLDRKVSKPASVSKTLRNIATIAFPNYKGRKIRLEVADHVDRQVEGGGTFYRDVLVRLSASSDSLRITQAVQQPDAYRSSGNLRTEIPFGSAYVSQHVFMGKDAGITIYIPPIDQATIDVAVDATLEAGKPTPAVTKMIGDALEGRGVMVSAALRDAYVALVAQLAGNLSSAESKAERY